MKKKSGINEELDRMKKIMNFSYEENSYDILSEEKMSMLLEGKLKGRGDIRKGVADFKGFDQELAFFKNIKMFDQFKKRQKFEITVDTDRKAGPSKSQLEIEPIDPTPPNPIIIDPEPDIPISINIPFSVDDPFTFDDDVLYPEAETKLNKFISNVNNLRENKLYESKVIDAYYEFLKSKPISVFGFASIDALSNYKITGSDKTSCGGTERLRHDYNKCLSKVRAEAIIEKLKSSDGILSELNYIAKGMGETNKYSHKKWNNNVANPTTDKKSPFTTEETKKDRKFRVALPTFTYEEPVKPQPEPDNPNDENGYPGWTEPQKTIWNPEALKAIETLNGNPEYSQIDDRGQISGYDIKSAQAVSNMNKACVKFDPTMENKQHPHKLKDGRVVYPLKGDLRVMSEEECYSNKFDIGSFFGIGKKIIGVTVDDKSGYLVFNIDSLNKVLGKDWRQKYTFPSYARNTGQYEMEISKKEITINGSGSMIKYSFPYSASNLLYGDVSTKPKWVVRSNGRGTNQVIFNGRGWFNIKKQKNYSIQDDGNNGQFPFGGG